MPDGNGKKFYTSIASLSNTTKYPLIVIDIVLQTDPDITAHRQGGQGIVIHIDEFYVRPEAA